MCRNLMAILQIMIFAKSFLISVHSLAPAIYELMNATNRHKQYCHRSKQENAY
jgi:hypothetical protein